MRCLRPFFSNLAAATFSVALLTTILMTTILMTTILMTTILVPPLVAQEVTLPLQRYEELREMAHPEPEPEPEPPLPVTFEKASLDIRVGASSARITQQLTLDLYGDDWTTVPLPNLGTYIDADFAGLQGRIESNQLEIRGQGRHLISLVSVVAVTPDETTTRPIRTLHLEAPKAALVSGELHPDDFTLEIETKGTVLVTATGDNGVRSWVADPGANFSFVLFGKAVAPQRSQLPLRFDAVSTSVHKIYRTRRELKAQVTARVLQGQLEALRIPLPEGFEVVDVNGQIAGWDVTTDAPKSRTLVIEPLTAITDQLRVKIALAARDRVAPDESAANRAPGGALQLTSIALSVEDAAGLLRATKVWVEGDGFLNLLDPGEARQPDARQNQRLPEDFRSVAGLALVIPRQAAAPSWQVVWPESTEVLAAQVDRLRLDAGIGTSGRAVYQLWAEVRSSGAPQLMLSLPGAELIAGTRDGVRLVPGQSGQGWVIPLSTTTQTQVIQLSLLLPVSLEPEHGKTLKLPIPAFSAPVARVEARIHLPGERRYTLADPSRAGRVAPIPTIVKAQDQSTLARQLSMGVDSPMNDATNFAAAFNAPRGYTTLEAVWNALSSTPAPLEILVKSSPTRKEWF